MKEELCTNAHVPLQREKTAVTLLIRMFHSKTLEKQKRRILRDLLNPSGSCRVVVATTPLAMGIDISDIKCVIHYGAPRDVIDYI